MTPSSDFHTLIRTQREYFGTHATKDIGFRKKQLRRLYDAIVAFTPRITHALKADLHKGETDAYTQEIGLCLKEISYAIRHLKKWAAPQRAAPPPLMPLSRGHTINEPYGVVLIIGTWNYPFSLVLVPLVGAIAAGNCVVVKPSEVASRSELVIQELIENCFKKHYIAVVKGDPEVTRKLLEERFDYCFFTGSIRIGKEILQAATRHLTPVTLELGGKCPCIVDATGNLEKAAARIVWGKFINAGQACVAPDFLLVHRDIEKALIGLLKEKIRLFYGSNPRESNDFGRIINIKQFNRLCGYLKSGTIISGGDAVEQELYIAPTLMTGISRDSSIMQEEIFGPILPIITVADTDEAIRIVNSMEKPLALYLFSSDRRTVGKVIRQTSSGGVAINDTVIQFTSEGLPFGGVGASGFGRYHGKSTFQTFSNLRSVATNTVLFDIPRFPPYRPFHLKLIRMMFR